MNAPLHVRSLRIHRLAIPMRVRFEHAAATRDTADPVIVELVGGAPTPSTWVTARRWRGPT